MINKVDYKEYKNRLRKEIKEKIAELDQDYCHRASHIICEKVMRECAYIKAKTLFCFVGVKGEPDTTEILRAALSEGKRVGVPLCISDGIMEVREIRDLEKDLASGYYGLLEPKADLPLIEADEIDFAVLPCVTCDHQGNRLGHGKGYYDRFLEGTTFPTCMICFEKLMVQHIPMDIHDKKADKVITDDE